MTYYFIALDPGRFEKFQRRISFLESGVWVEDRDRLSEILAEAPEEAVFFLQLSGDLDEVSEWGSLIRSSWETARLIYVTRSLGPQELKEHQSGEAGGDAYVHETVDEDMLADILKSLVPDLDIPRNKLDSQENFGPAVNKLDALGAMPESPGPTSSNPPESDMEEIFSDLSALKKMTENPLSKAMDELFTNVLQLKKSKGLEIPDIGGGLALPTSPKKEATGDKMSDKDHELSLDDMGELELGSLEDAPASAPVDEGLSLDEAPDLNEVELDLGGGEAPAMDLSDAADIPPLEAAPELGTDLDLDPGLEIVMGRDESEGEEEESDDELSLGEDDELSLDDDLEEGLSLAEDDDEEAPEEGTIENIGELDLSLDDLPSVPASEAGAELDIALGGDDSPPAVEDLALGGDELSLGEGEGLSLGGEELSLGDEGLSLGGDELSFGDLETMDAPPATADGDLSDDARKKLMEIDALMDQDASQVNITITTPGLEDELGLDADVSAPEEALSFSSSEESLDTPLVSEDINLDSINFSSEADSVPEETVVTKAPPETPAIQPKEGKTEVPAARADEGGIARDFKELAGAYSGEMERTQATIANLRADREELLARIQQLEDEKLVHNRQMLTIRAELDERKIELTIIRKKLNEEINELKDRLRLQEERKLVLEEKNRTLMQELDKAGQKNKIDLKKVQLRERELEQKLELLKSDAETQIKNRDLKILELKRKIDAMEFDMESISMQEKRSVESRFELEDKLDKAIKTLRTAISELEDETDRASALSALKKNIDV